MRGTTVDAFLSPRHYFAYRSTPAVNAVLRAFEQEIPDIVQLTEQGAGRVPGGCSWMAFDVDSVAPSCNQPGLWIVHVRDYRYGKDPAGMLGRNYQIWSLRPGDYERV